MLRKHKRSFNQLLDSCLLPFSGICPPGPDDSKRICAIVEVLSTIPEDDFIQLEDLIDDFQWFIPHQYSLGQVYPFSANVYPEEKENLVPYAKVLYLSPFLEDHDISINLAVVAHELAHIILRHKLRCNPEEYKSQEEDAWEKVVKWGFEKEAKRHEAL